MKKNFKNLKKKLAIERFNLLLTKIKEIKITNFQIIFSIYAVIFSVFLFLSLPGLFDYEKYIEEIKDKSDSDFKIHLENISKVKYRFIPAPHLIIEEVDLKFSKNSQSTIAKLKDVKLFISLIELYSNKKISIKRLLINNGNFYFKNDDFILFNKHLAKKIIKPIKIKNSNFFYINSKNQVATISPIQELNYFIDFKNKEKELKIKGKLFDINYDYKWLKNYNNPNNTKNEIKFKNPNINFLNLIKKNINEENISGNSKINFLNNKINLNYVLDQNKLVFETKKRTSEIITKVDFSGKIDLNPFFFDINLILKELDIALLNQQIFFYLYKMNNSIHPNLNGNFSIKINNKNKKLFNNLNFKFSIKEGKINITKSEMNLKKIGKIKFSNFKYIEQLDKLYLKSTSELIIDDQIEFYRRFQIPKKHRINLEKIYFDIETNVDEKEFYLFNLSINSKKNLKINIKNENEAPENEINNIQQLTKIIRNSFEKN